MHNAQVLKFLPPTEIKNQDSNKILEFGKSYFSRGGGGGVFFSGGHK